MRHPARVVVGFAILLTLLGTATPLVAQGGPSLRFAAPRDVDYAQVTRSGMQLSWPAVTGAPGYRVKLVSGAGTTYVASATNSLLTTGLKPSTTYWVRVTVAHPVPTPNAAQVLSPESPAARVATSAYAQPSPDGLRQVRQSPTSIELSWQAPAAGLAGGLQYQVEYGENAAVTVGRQTAGPFSGTTATLKRLDDNHTYFARVHVVDAATKQASGSSDAVLIKTLVPRGTITGRATGVSGSDLVATAYASNGEAAQEVPVSRDGDYSLSVRPGSYRIQVSYLGNGNHTSPWSRSGSAGGRVPAEASTWKVTAGRATKAADVQVSAGGQVKGVVRDPSGQPVRDVHVTALTMGKGSREVAGATTTSDEGHYALKGLADGAYTLRYVYSGDGFAPRSITVTVRRSVITQVQVSTSKKARTASVANPITAINARVDTAPFRVTRRASISGAKVVGATLTAKATPWLAGAHPTTRATMSLRWKRDGVGIPGATRATYRLTSADRGRGISVTATATRYGYQTGSVTSKSYPIL